MSGQSPSKATKTRHHGLRGTGPKRGVLAAAVALCCVLGIGTAVAAGALTDEGTTAPSGSSEALQTASFDAGDSSLTSANADGTVQTLAADTPAVIDDDDEVRTSTEIVMDLSSAGNNLQPTLHLEIYEDAEEITVNWGDDTSQTASYDENTEHTVDLPDGEEVKLSLVDVTKEEPYEEAGEYTISITSEYDEGPAYLLGQGFYKVTTKDGDTTVTTANWTSLVNQAGETEVYGAYLVSVATADNAGVQADSFYGSSDTSYPQFTEADFSHCDTSLVNDMQYMFVHCDYLTTIDVSGFDTSNVTELKHMFQNCAALTGLDFSGWDTSNVTTMHYLCDGCSALTSITFGDGWDTSQVEEMHYMFNGCSNSSLTTLDVSGFDTSQVTNMSYMFDGCQYVSELDVSGFDTSQVTNLAYMFYNCRGVSELDVSGFDTSKVTSLEGTFYYCSGLTELDLSSWDVSAVTSLHQTFTYCSKLQTLDLTGWNPSSNKSLQETFRSCEALTEVDLSGWDTSNVTTMQNMFYTAHALQSLGEENVSGWDTSNVTTMSYAFSSCRELTAVDVSGWDTAKVTNISSMFSGCYVLEELSFANWDTSKITTTSSRSNLFSSDTKLRKVTLGENFQLKTNELPTPNFTDPYKATGKWQKLDEATQTLGDAKSSSSVSKSSGSAQEVWCAEISEMDESWLELAEPSMRYTGEPITPTFQLTSTGASQDPTIGEQDAVPGFILSYEDSQGNPVEEMVDPGVYTVTATATGNPITGTGNYGGSASYRFVVSQIAELEWEDEAHPEANSETGIFRTYDGTESNVVCHIVGKPDNVDCEVIVDYGTEADAGFHTAQAVGLEGADSDLYALSDYCFGPYYIEPCPITPEMFIVETERTYEEGTVIEPAELVTVTTDTSISPLPTDEDYTVTCTDEAGDAVTEITDAGTYTIIITGTHNFKGEQTYTFVLDPADSEPTTIPGTDGNPLTAIYGDTLDTVDLSSYDEDGTWAWAVEDASATFVGNVGSNVFAATWTPDDHDYAPYTTDLTVVVAPLSIEEMSFSYDPDTMAYTGTALYPTISADNDPVTGEPMIEGSDFTVTYCDESGAETTPVGVGSYTFTITGTYNFTGELPTGDTKYTFTITQATPTEDIPTGLTATYGDTLADIVLPRSSDGADAWGWAWDNPETPVGDVGEHQFSATYTPGDDSYAKDSQQLTVTVLPKPVDFTWSETERSLTPDDQGSLGWTYDGKDVNVTASFTEGSIINGDEVTITVSGGDTKDAGVHHATVSEISDGKEPCNYTFEDSLTAGCYYYIEHATAVIDIFDASKVYGETDPEQYEYELEDGQGLLTDKIELEIGRTDSDDPDRENAGIHSGVIDATYTLDETLADNYIITVRKGNLLIERADISKMEGWDLDEDSVTYDGQEHADRVKGVPTDPVTNEDMIAGTDYNVSYAHNTDAGTATFVITGTGNYTGIITDTFTIDPAEVTIKCEDAEKDFGDPDPDEFTGEVTGLINDDDLGEVTYTREPGENAGTYAIYPVYTENSNYTVTVVEGTFTIHPKTTEGDTDLTFTLEEGPFTYNGNEITPGVTGSDNGTPLTEGVDFTVKYQNNIHAGEATAIVDCCGNYSGKVELTFTIDPAEVTITCVDASKTYGDPDPTLGGRVTGISAKDDLGVSYSRGQGEAVGEYEIDATYTPNSDYTVTVVKGTFTIDPKDESSSDLSFTLDQDSFTYMGGAITPTVSGMDGSKELTADEDFTVTYEDNTNAGTAKAIVEGTGNYSGTVELTFTIEPAGIDVTWTSNIGGAPNTFTRVYDGTPLTVSASVANGLLGDDASKGFEVTVEDASATDVGVYMATATGITQGGVANGNYTINSSTAYCAYSIDTAQLTLAQFTVDTKDKEYTGSEIQPTVESSLSADDYTVSYSDNVELGTATITITGQGNYGGKLTYHFEIVKYTPQVTVPGPFKATYGDKLGTLDLNGTMAEPGSANDGSWVWTAGEDAYVGDAGTQTAEAVYTPADTTYANTVTADITIEVSPISIKGMEPGFTYSNPDEVDYAGYILSADITPPNDPVTGRPLIEGTDYTVTYYVDNGDGTHGEDPVDPKNVGSYVFYIDGMGNYCDRFDETGGTLTINRANPEQIAPSGLTATYGDTLESVILPRSDESTESWGWAWDNPDSLVGNVGDDNTFDATFTPEDPNTQDTINTKLSVTVSPKPVELDWTEEIHTEASYIDGAYDWVYDGQNANLQATIAEDDLVDGDTCTVTEYKDNTEKDAGMHMATAVSLDNENYTLSATTASCYYYIEHASVTIEVADATKTYGEGDPVFEYTVEGLADGESLDITCSRTDGDDPEREDAGVHNGVIVATYTDPSGIAGNYTIATKAGSLIIERATFDEETKDEFWTVNTDDERYDGTAKTKAISGTSPYGVELVEGTDYTVTYNHNVEAGTAVITVTGQGNYSFMLTWTFEILPVDVIITCGNAEKTYGEVDPAMPAYTVTPEDAAASLGTITCSREKGEDADTYAITASYTASGNYSVSVVPGTFTINRKPLDEADFAIDEGPYTYTGTEIEPAVTGIDQTTSKLLAQGTDYTVEYSDNVAVGTGSVAISCTGNYSGEFTLYFEIVASAFGEAVFDVTVDGDTYNGQPHEVTVTPAAGSDLQPYDPATDEGDYSYTITDADGNDCGTESVTDAGTYTVTITGHGNYEGSTYTYEFTIAPAVIGLTWADTAHNAPYEGGLITFTYDGMAANVSATATGLIDDDECTVEVSGGTEVYAGVHMATAVSLSNANYTLPGHAYCTYYIAPAQLTDEMFKVDTDDKPYSDEGYAIDDLVKVADGANPTPTASEYTVTCTNEAGDEVTTATDVGTYTITIQGKSNFTGKLTYSFQITKETPEPAVTVPAGTEFEATYGDTFGDIDLSAYNADDTNGSWGWADSEAFVGNVDTYECELIYTPADTEHVATATVGVTVTVSARSIETMQPTFVIASKEDTYTGYPIYGDITVPADPVTGEPMVEGTDYSVSYHKYDEDSETYGEESVTPTGVGQYTFVITGTGNYKDVLNSEHTYTLTIDKATPSKEFPPENLTATYGDKLEDIILPRSDESDESWGWSWDEAYFDQEDLDEEHYFTASGPHTYAAKFTPEDDDDYEDYDVGLTVTVLPKAVELAWSDTAHYPDADNATGFSRVYDGEASNLTATVTEDSLVHNDTDITVTAYEENTAADAGVHTATATTLSSDNYTLEGSSSATCSYYIERAPVTVIPDNKTKPYGEGDPTLTGTIVGDVADGDSIGTVTYTRTAGEDVGTYTITATVADANPNYQIACETGTFTITPVDFGGTLTDVLTFTLEDGPFPYTGQPIEPQVSVTDADGNAVDTDEFSITYVNNVNAGTATVVIVGNGNYEGIYTTTFTIDKATPAVTAPDGLTATYGDTLGSLTLPDGWTFDEGAAAAVGDVGPQLHAATYTPADTANYNTVSANVTVTVSPKQITEAMFTVDTANVEYTGYDITKSVLGVDGASVMARGTDYTVTYTLAGSSPAAAAHEPGTYTITIEGTGNYTGDLTYTFEVTKPIPAYTTPAGLTAVYGDTLAAVELPDGWAWDDATASVGEVGSNAFAATYTPDDENYATVAEELSVTVTPRPITLTWSGEALVTYDGTEHAVTAAVSASDLVGSDSCEVTVTGGSAINVGPYTATATLSNTNYTATNDTFAYTIEHRTVVVYADDASKTHGAALSSVTFTGGYTNLADADSGTFSVTGYEVPDWDADTEQVGETYAIVPTYAWSDEGVAANYDVQVVDGELKIVDYEIPSDLTGTYGDTLASITLPSGWTWVDATTQILADAGSTAVYPALFNDETNNLAVTVGARTVTLSWADTVSADGTGDRTYDGRASAVGATAGNLVGSDTCTVTIENGDAVDAGTYTARAVALSNANYALPADATYVYHIERASAVIAVADATKVKGAADPKLTGHVDGLVAEGDLGEIVYSREEGEAVGSYQITATYTANANYTVTVEPGTFTITAATTKKDDSLHVGDTFWYHDGQYTVTSLTTARYNWPRATTTKANVATTIHRGGLTLNVTKIKKTAFKNRTKLTVIKIGNHVKKIPKKEFKGCKNVTKIVLGKDVKTIGKASAKGLKKLKKVNIKSTKLKKIAAKAFQNDKKLKTVKIKSKKLKTIGKLAFAGCKKLKKMNLKSKKLKKIGAKAFKGDKKLKKFVVKSPKLKKIGKKCFKGCKKLKAITLKSTKLKAKGVIKALSGSKVRLIKTSTSTKKTKALSKKLRKLYKKDFKKKNSGRKVAVR